MKANVIEATEQTFQTVVIEKSHEVPVLVDFWAPWCGPCRVLTPVLEQLASEGDGAWLLVKVNSDDNQPLSAHYGVRGIPNVKLFKDGAIVDEFVGAQPKAAVQRFLQKWVTSKLDKQVAAAEGLIAEGKVKQGRSILEGIASQKPEHEKTLLALAQLELAEGHSEAALGHLEFIPVRGPHGALAEQLRAKARFTGAKEESLEALIARVDAEPQNLDARFDLARAAVNAGEYDTAAQNFLYIIQRNRRYQDRAAHKAMLDLFLLIGEDDPRTPEYREQLSWILFS